MIAHATFCIVVIYNNVIARLRRLGTSLEEASMDLGADTFTTFRPVTFPQPARGPRRRRRCWRSGCRFDEIVVTLFTAPPGVTTLPIWIFQNLSRPNQAPVVNVVAAALVLLSIVPIYISQRLVRASPPRAAASSPRRVRASACRQPRREAPCSCLRDG